ncbi:zinc finger, CCHC-type containing protein [Tanacetum coccineum]
MAVNTVKEMTTNFGKLDKFQGHNFRRWQKKMHFLLTALKVVYVLTTPMPEWLEDATVEAIRVREKWENNDYICRGHILNGMSDSLFDVYTNVESAKELWDSLESKPVMEQYNELLRILRQYTQHGLKMAESISVSSIIDKLPPSWKDLKHTLKHGKDDLSLVQLGSHLRIEESLRAQESDKGKVVLVPTRNQSWNVRSVARLVTSKEIAVVVDAIAWWIDSGAITHVCKDCCWFKKYEPVEDGSVLYMGDDHFAPVHGRGNVVLEFSSGKSITLFNVLYVPKLCKNLISGPVLNKCGYKQVYESDKYILSKSGIIHETTASYTLQQNSMAERKNRALKEMVNSMLSYSGLSEGFQGEAMAVVRLPNPKRKTLGEKGIDCIFVGYAEHSKAYRPKDIIPNSVESQMDDHYDDVPSETPEPHKVKGSRDQYSYCYSIKEDPKTYDEAMQSQDAAFLKEAIDDEIGSIMENNTWVLSDLTPGCKPLGCKWIFKRKMKVDGTIDKFKARLVIQGFIQKEVIDYFDTYAPVARITTIRMLLALVAIHNIVIHQMDVKTTFLNGDLDEEVYMKQPKGFVMPGNEHKFSKKDMGEAYVILGIKIKRGNKGIVITQSHYIKKILKKFNREDYSLVSTPMDLVEKLKPNTVGRLSRFTSNPSRQHWQAITRNQTASLVSTMESEFVALAAAGKEAKWLRNLIHEIPIWPKPIAPISIRCDSAPTMAKAYSQIYNGKSRHLGVRHSMVRELIRNGVISIEFVWTQRNLADHLTKGLARDLVMAEKDAFLVDNVEGGLCVDYTDAEIGGRYNSGNDTNKGKLWGSLESKYMAEDSSSKKFLHGLKMDESISVSSITDKLLPSWKDFKHTLKHGKDDLSLVQLGSHLRIKESLREQESDKGKGKEVGGPSIEEDPRTYNEAMQSRDAAFLKEAVDDEIGSIMENNTWVLSDLPLVANDLQNKDERLLLALAAIHNLVIHQMDVKTTFLNGDLDEEVYMKQPEGFVMPGNEHKIEFIFYEWMGVPAVGEVAISWVSRSKHILTGLLWKSSFVALAAGLVMAEKDAFLVDNVEGCLCVDYTDAGIGGRCNSGNNTNKGKLKSYGVHLNLSTWQRGLQVRNSLSLNNTNNMDESISVSSITDKLPPSRKDLKHTLKHGKDDLSLVQLSSHLRIDESLRAQESDKGKGKEVGRPSVNMIEEGKDKHNKQNKEKKHNFKEHSSGNFSYY